MGGLAQDGLEYALTGIREVEMKQDTFLKRFLADLAILVLVLGAYVLVARPYQLHWGATRAEIERPMPGDALDPNPTFLATRAITIDGTPEQIWPWLVQIGYGRAGFYGYDILENMGSPSGPRSADRIVDEYQHFQVGDVVPISAVAQMVFGAIEPYQYLIWQGTSSTNPGAFTWALYPLDGSRTRLVMRIRWSYHSLSQPGLLGLDLFTEFTDHLAVRKILVGIQERVEGQIEPPAQANFEFFVYVGAAVIFLAAFLLVLLRPLNRARWLAGAAAGLGWLITWYAPVSIWIGLLVELAIVFSLVWVFRRQRA